MKVIATLEFIHPYEGGLFQKDVVYDVTDNDGNNTLIKIGYFRKYNGEVKVAEPIKNIPEMRFVKTERKFSTDKAEKESKEVVETKEYKGKKKTK